MGSSARQGEHHDAHTFTTATLPGVNEKFLPLNDIPEISGAATRLPAFIFVTAPLPAM